jgi:hypothetical protein
MTMHRLIRILAGLPLAGCGGNEPSDSTARSGHDTGNSKRHDQRANHVGPDYGEGGDAAAEDQLEHEPAARALGSVAIGDTILGVSSAGRFESGSDVDVEVVVTGGPEPAAVRLWIGQQSGIGALKIKAHAHDDQFHGLVKVPAELANDAALWIEVESSDGKRESKSLALR